MSGLLRYLDFKTHPQDTDVPQTYLQHGKNAGYYSARLIYFGVLGLVHAVIPEAFKFDTSTEIIRDFKVLADSGRHMGEIKEVLGDEYLRSEFLDIGYLKERKRLKKLGIDSSSLRVEELEDK